MRSLPKWVRVEESKGCERREAKERRGRNEIARRKKENSERRRGEEVI